MLPERLTLIDETSRADHRYLGAEDQCFCFGEIFARSEFRYGVTNRMIFEFQCKPSLAAVDPDQRSRKERAIIAVATGLRAAISQADAERCTWVPIPPARATDHPDYDDRLARTLRRAFDGYAVDVRAVLRYAAGADRAAADNPLWVDVAALRERPLRQRIALFDDLLCTGRHFRWAQRRLRELVPAMLPISGLFLARRVLQDPAEPEQR